MFQVRNLWTKKETKVIHHNLNWEIKDKDYWVLAGRSGSGKTTLARIMVGLETPSSGQILWNGLECSDLSSLWGMQSQSNSLFRDSTAMENITFSLKYERADFKEKFLEEVAAFYFDEFGLDLGLLEAYPNELSGGQKKFVALARALAKNPRMLLLDEPTAGLDPGAAVRYDEILQKVVDANNMSVVVITHDLQRIKGAPNLAFMENGKIRICNPASVDMSWWKPHAMKAY